MSKSLVIYDLETYPNFFLAVFKDIRTNEFFVFEISDRRNDRLKLLNFLRTHNIRFLIGFNNYNFDYPVLHNTILTGRDVTAYDIYQEVEKVINSEFPSIKDKNIKIPQLDLFKIHHYDNLNKATSLKWLEFAMRMDSIEDLPFKPGTYLTYDQMDVIIAYCKHDIEATHMFYNKSRNQILLRRDYSKLENFDFYNSSEGGIAREIFSKVLSKELGISQWEVKKLRTKRSEVKISEIIFPYIEFKDPENIKTLETFKSKVWKYDLDTEKALASIKFTSTYKNVTREYAEGGLHSFGKPGIFTSNDEWGLRDVDFRSYYPHLTFKNKLHPEHIPEKVFNVKYEGFYNERLTYPKTDVRNFVLKLILNLSYGLSKDKHSFLYDPKWQLAVCINGQLLLTMLTERVLEYIPEAVICFENTDGVQFYIPNSKDHLLNKACSEIEDLCKIELEIQSVHKFIGRDVNNYLSIIDPKTVKYKGAFEINKDYHKNHSKRIVPLMVANYFINNIKPEQTIINHMKGMPYNLPADRKSHTNFDEDEYFYKNHGIFDFCIGNKSKGDNILVSREIIDFETIDTPLHKTNRYIVTKEGVNLIKILPPLESKLNHTDSHKVKIDSNQMNIFDFIEDVEIDAIERESNLEVGYKCTLMNKLNVDQTHDYYNLLDIDYYTNEAYKIINKIENTQYERKSESPLRLF